MPLPWGITTCSRLASMTAVIQSLTLWKVNPITHWLVSLHISRTGYLIWCQCPIWSKKISVHISLGNVTPPKSTSIINVYHDCPALLLPLKHITICFKKNKKYYFLFLQCEIIIASKCFGRLFKNFPEKPQFTLEIAGDFKN